MKTNGSDAVAAVGIAIAGEQAHRKKKNCIIFVKTNTELRLVACLTQETTLGNYISILILTVVCCATFNAFIKALYMSKVYTYIHTCGCLCACALFVY